METRNQGKVRGHAEKFMHLSTRAFAKKIGKQGQHRFQGMFLWNIHGAVAQDAEAQGPAHRFILAERHAIFVIVGCFMVVMRMQC